MRKYESLSGKFVQGSRRHDLEFTVPLHQLNQSVAEGVNKFLRMEVSSRGRKIYADGIDGDSRRIKCLLVFLDPLEDFLSGWKMVRAGHGVTGRIPEIRSGHHLRHRQVHHGLGHVHLLVAVPGIIQDPGWLALGKRAEGVHADLIIEPVRGRAG